MRQTGLLSLLALSLLAGPALSTASTPALASTPVPATSTAAQAGSGAVLGPASVTRSARLVRAAAKPAPKAVPRPRRTAPRPVAKPVAQPAAQPAAAPVVQAPARTGSYAFLHVDAGSPVRWNPCADVPWVFNPAGAPAGGLAAVQAAVRELGARTGLSFAYQGTSSDAVSATYLQQTWKQFRPLLVGWTTAAQSDMLAGRTASTVGMARVLWTGSYDSTGANRTQIASGVVAFNAATRAPTSGAGSWYTYALHELGHAVGLAHVEDAGQVMNPVIGNGVSGFGSGDLAGLTRLGRDAGCLPAIR